MHLKINSYVVNIAFINIKSFKTEIRAINEFQAMQKALAMHDRLTGCGTNEMYSNVARSVKLIK